MPRLPRSTRTQRPRRPARDHLGRRITLATGYFRCHRCGLTGHILDEHIGVCGSLSVQAERLVALAAASWSFDRASAHLAEFCGLRVSDDMIRGHSLETGRQMREFQRDGTVLREPFVQAAGGIEFATDGTSVNTLGGWREMRVGIFAKRPAGAAATPEQWDERDLPAPTARVLFGGFWSADQFGPQWRAWAQRLGIVAAADITVLSDGAKWIWRQVEENLPGASGLLDIYHASEHLYATAKVLCGEEGDAAGEWVEDHRQTLLHGGELALRERLQAERKHLRSPRQRQSLSDLLDYLEPHTDHCHYKARLAAGGSIGSGIVEGACKTVVGRRLKQTGARWRLRHAERALALCGLLYGDHWNHFWADRAA